MRKKKHNNSHKGDTLIHALIDNANPTSVGREVVPTDVQSAIATSTARGACFEEWKQTRVQPHHQYIISGFLKFFL
jgi:hypothetical protein